MPLLLLKDLPRYECLLKGARKFPDLDPSACEAYLNLLRTSDVVFGVMERYLSDHHISPGRFSVLMLLRKASRAGNCEDAPRIQSPAELAQATGVTRATMTGLIDTLEHDGLVQRKPEPKDRRMMSVELTEKGEAFLHELLPGHFRLMASFMGTLSEAERKTLVALLNKILRQVALRPETETAS